MELFKLYGNILIKNEEATQSLHSTQKDAIEVANKFEKMAESGTSSGSKLNGAFKGIQNVLSTFGVNLSDNAVLWGTWAVAGIAAVAEISKKLYELTAQTSEYGDNIDKMSQKLGLSTEAYQKWDYVIGLAGGDIDSMSAGFKTMTNTLADAQNGTESAIEKFTALGISMEDINNLDSEQMFEKVICTLQNMDDQTQKAAAANDLFGKSGQNLLPLLNQTNDETQELIDSTSELGLIMSEDSVEASAKFKDTQTTIKAAMDATSRSLGEMLMPYFQRLLDWVMDHMPEIQNIMTSAFEFIVGAIELVSPVIETVLTAVGALVDGVSWACDMLDTLLSPLFEFIEDSLNVIIDLINAVTFGLLDLDHVGSSSSQAWDKWLKEGEKTTKAAQEGKSLTGFANGGVVTSIKSVVGESGPEILDLSGSAPVITPISNGRQTTSGGNIFNITIDAKNVKEFNDVVRIMKTAQQRERMGTV